MTNTQPARTHLDLSQWAVVAHKDDTGFGRQAEDIRSILGVGYHLAIPSERLADKPLVSPNEIRLSPRDSEARLRELLQGRQGIVFFERPNWHPSLLPIARELGVKTVCVPNWEWFRGKLAVWQDCDLFVCPTRYTLKVVRNYGWRNAVYLPWLVDLDRFPTRSISGPARLFIHNAGFVDRDDRKGTREAIEAFKRAKHPDIRLLVRMQNQVELPQLDDRIEVCSGNLDDPSDLYASGDVAIQPSKMEGIGFMAIEAVCSGIPTLTIDYPPMNEFVRQPQLLARTRWFKRKAFASQWVKQAHLKLPRIDDLALRVDWCASHDLGEISRANRAFAEATFGRDLQIQRWSELLNALCGDRLEAYLATLPALPE
ncbi:glycosyltransferase [Synechococcus sp. PCC 7336]|uniref:glycosyltransferase n=1 Tax=Synechococcus sp. PCC 7336 TaxID=195250 RepID=UPI0003480CE5|nr:glycosyltransferase [Synechococcus sp. PCC 7336]